MTRCSCDLCAAGFRRGDNLTAARGAFGSFTCVVCGVLAVRVIADVQLAAGDVRCDKHRGAHL